MASACKVTIWKAQACNSKPSLTAGCCWLFRPHSSKSTSVLLASQQRTYLSKAYECSDLWNARLSSGLLNKLRHEEFYVELRKRFDGGREVSPVDMDIYANLVQNQATLTKLEELLALMRKTLTCPRTLKGTHFAVIRQCYQLNANETLMRILQDRIKYGIFLDPINANLLMNRYLLGRDYLNAARIAVELMLQEDFSNHHEHRLSRSLAILSCLKYLDSVLPTLASVAAAATNAAADAPTKIDAAAGKPKSTEAPAEAVVAETLYPPIPAVSTEDDEDADEMLIYVHFLKAPYFDNHFDLRKTRKLLGKTFLMAGASVTTEVSSAAAAASSSVENEALYNSCIILGLVMYRKFDKLEKFLSKSARAVAPAAEPLALQSDASPPPFSDKAVVTSKIPVTQDLHQLIERVFSTAAALPQADEADVVADASATVSTATSAVVAAATTTTTPSSSELHVMERPSDKNENLYKEASVTVSLQASIIENLQKYTHATNTTDSSTMISLAENLVRAEAADAEARDIAQHQQQLQHWSQLREDCVAQEVRKHEIDVRLQAIRDRRLKLTEEEEMLMFFERKTEWELMMDAEALAQLKAEDELVGAPYDYRVQDSNYEENQMPAPVRTQIVKWWKPMQEGYDRKRLRFPMMTIEAMSTTKKREHQQHQ